MAERWRDIPEYKVYQASSKGRIRSKTRKVKSRWGTFYQRQGTVLSPYVGEYNTVKLSKNGGVKTIKVAVLVLLAFVGPRPNSRMDSCHNDGNAHNDRLSNLRWGSKKSNSKDRIAHGTQICGEDHPKAQVDESIARRVISDKRPQAIIARELGLSQASVSDIQRGKTWKHLGLQRHNRRRKISDDDVRLIRKSSKTDEHLATVFGVSQVQIFRIRNRTRRSNVI